VGGALEAGAVVLGDQPVTGLPAWRVVRLGLGYVPETRRVFPGLTVAENLEAGRRDGPGPDWSRARLEDLFPNLAALRDRRAGQISGGEQQMLAIARTLMGRPSLLLLDEPSEGLAPVIVKQLAVALAALRDRGLTLVLAEQNPSFVRALAQDACVLDAGRQAWSGPLEALHADPALRRRLLSL